MRDTSKRPDLPRKIAPVDSEAAPDYNSELKLTLMSKSNSHMPVAVSLVTLLLCGWAAAQESSQSRSPSSSSCSRDLALTVIQQQIDATKTFDDDVRRINVLIRAADLIWPHKENRARAAFSEAFDIATRLFKEKGEPQEREGRLIIIGSGDPRYVVVSAIAKRDSAWARKLVDQMLADQRNESDEKPVSDSALDISRAERLLETASALLSSDQAAALNFARISFRYPATFFLSTFLYQLAAIDRSAADQLYQQALPAYANVPMERLLYLSSYPFGNDREAGEMPGYMVYQVPNGFSPNPTLQRMFVQTILRRAEAFMNDSSDAAPVGQLTEPEQMWLALTRLQKQIQQSLPELAPAVEAARGNLFTQLPQNSQHNARQTIADDNPPKLIFDEQVEAALKNPNVDWRDQQLVSAIMGASQDEKLDHVLSAMDEISDSAVRQPLLDWLYFDRAQRAIRDRKLEEARKLAAKVDQLDQRAYLYSRIAEESLTHHPDQTQAREVLEEVLDATTKAPNTPVTARALLGVAYLYTQIDMNRAVAIMAEAVKVINRIEQPDFSRQFVIRKIEGKSFGTYASFVTPGFNPENAFREIGKMDFDGMLNQASNFSDKSLRALTTLAVAEQCLKDRAVSPKTKQSNTPGKPK
jgi:hypothetical protein